MDDPEGDAQVTKDEEQNPERLAAKPGDEVRVLLGAPIFSTTWASQVALNQSTMWMIL